MSADHASSAKAIKYAFFANLGIAITKGFAAVYTNSGSMLAEAIHSVADSTNQVLLFIGMKQAEKPPTTEHPLGFGKVTYFWSFVVALMLFSVGGLFSIYEGLHKLREPEPISQAWIALVVLGIAIVLETLSLLGCLKEISKLRRGRSLRDWLKHTRNAELVVVLGEDIAAELGLIIAFAFVGLAAHTGDTRWDAAGSIAIGVVLIVVALFVSLRIKSLMVGRSAEPEVQRGIIELIERDPSIDELLNTITMQFGPQVMLAAKIRMKPGLLIDDAVHHINELERQITERYPQIVWCFIEPDVSD